MNAYYVCLVPELIAMQGILAVQTRRLRAVSSLASPTIIVDIFCGKKPLGCLIGNCPIRPLPIQKALTLYTHLIFQTVPISIYDGSRPHRAPRKSIAVTHYKRPAPSQEVVRLLRCLV